MDDLNGKIAVVTGGGSGIGAGICRALTAEGAKVVVADVDGDKAEAVASSLRVTGAEARAEVVDVSCLASVQRLAEATLGAYGGVDVVCNNAGVYLSGSVRDLTPDDWRWVMSVNLDGVYHGCRVFVPLLLDRGAGHIVNTASLEGGIAGDEAGAMTVRGIRRNAAFIFTDTTFGPAVRDRYERIIASMDEQAAAESVT